MTMDPKVRPYAHPQYNNIKLEKLCGQAYRFQITFPMAEDDRKIFSDEQKAQLVQLLTNDFDGCTLTDDITHPLMKGTYKDEEGNILKGKHTQINVYTCQTEECIEYFKKLQKTLEETSGEETILIELSPVRLIGTEKEEDKIPEHIIDGETKIIDEIK